MSYVLKYGTRKLYFTCDESGAWTGWSERQRDATRFDTPAEALEVRLNHGPPEMPIRIVRLKPPAGMVPETVVDEVVDGADRLVKALILLFRGGTHWFVSEADLARGDEYDLRYSRQSEDGSIIVSVVRR